VGGAKDIYILGHDCFLLVFPLQHFYSGGYSQKLNIFSLSTCEFK